MSKINNYSLKEVLTVVCDYYECNQRRVRFLGWPKRKDYLDNVAIASKIAQALMVGLCDVHKRQIGAYMNRAEVSVRNNYKTISNLISEDKDLASDIASICRLLSKK